MPRHFLPRRERKRPDRQWYVHLRDERIQANMDGMLYGVLITDFPDCRYANTPFRGKNVGMFIRKRDKLRVADGIRLDWSRGSN